jgi:hypothetical protein
MAGGILEPHRYGGFSSGDCPPGADLDPQADCRHRHCDQLWCALGRACPERQWGDILGILAIQRDLLDRAYLQQWAPTLGVVDLLDEAWAAAGLA